MICFIIVFSFVKLIFARHTGYAQTCTHAQAHTLQALIRVCVSVSGCMRFGCVSVCALYCRAQMVRILLCLFKATTIESQTLELNHKHWEILLLT